MVKSERRRGFQPPWYTVFLVSCDGCGTHLYTVRKNWHGPTPPGALPTGRVECEPCAKLTRQLWAQDARF